MHRLHLGHIHAPHPHTHTVTMTPLSTTLFSATPGAETKNYIQAFDAPVGVEQFVLFLPLILS